MKLKEDTYTVAAIVARFQIHELHQAHKDLINTVLNKHPKVLIFLGLSPVRGSINNPLDFQPRKQMLLEEFPPSKYPNLTIGYIKDSVSDEVWSTNLDQLISDHLAPTDKAVLYGSRDSFLPHYKGRFATLELASDRQISGTEIRKMLAEKPQSQPLFRAGAIWASHQRYPTVFSTVDVAVYDYKEKKVLLARKPDEDQYRFVGGFVSPSDDSIEEAAARELEEETGVIMAMPTLEYLGSYKIDDWRYRNEVDKIITHFYLTYFNGGVVKANDDIAEVRWFDPNAVDVYVDIVEGHRVLWNAFICRLDSKVPMGKANLQTITT